MVLSEAGAAGLPLVASRVAAVPEIVREDTGILVRPGNVGELTAALYQLVTNPERRWRLGRQAAAVTRREFDAGQNAQRLLTLLKQVVDENRS